MSFQAITFPAANKSLESIPARSFVRIDSGQNVDIGGSPFRVVNGYKPNGTAGEYWVTGDGLVPDTEDSQFVMYIPVSPVWVKFSAAPTGTTCGPVDDEWTASDSGSGFKILYYDETVGYGLIIKDSSAAPIIRFGYSATNGIASAICEIKSRIAGSATPDTILDGSAVIVHDPSGCYFTGPSEDLTGRQGWAAYMDSGSTAMPDQVYAEPHWEVFAMCCDDSECYE